VMLAVMNLHGLPINVWFERIKCVGKRGKFKCHSSLVLIE
jgi:hypothetical protein